MAIIIPSSKIFNIDRPLVLKNKVDKVGVDTNVVKPNNEYDISVYNKSFIIEPILNQELIDVDLYGGYGDNRYWQRACFVGIKTYRMSLEFVVSRNKQLGYISAVKIGKDQENNFNIKTSLVGKLFNGVLKVDLQATHRLGVMQEQDYNITYNMPIYNNGVSHTLQNITDDMLIVEQSQSAVVTNPPVQAKVEANNINNLGDTNVIIEENEKEYKFKIELICSYEKYYGKQTISIPESEAQSFIENEQVVECQAEKFEPKQLEITIYGDTIAIDLTNETFEFGEGENPLAISGNELLQDGTTTKGFKTNDFIATNIIKQYSNGKEKATLRCAIGNYFDENGEKKISIDKDNLPMEFSVGDEVIPMVYIGNNEEKFMSSKDGKPKKYEVASVKPYFDGACWQEIEIIEKNL